MNHYQNPSTFIPYRVAASRLGVSAAWLKREALAERVPCLRVGRRLMMNCEAVKRALLERAEQSWIGGQQNMEVEG